MVDTIFHATYVDATPYMLRPTFTARGLPALAKLAFNVLASIISPPEQVLVKLKSMLWRQTYQGVLGRKQRREDTQIARSYAIDIQARRLEYIALGNSVLMDAIKTYLEP